MNAPATAMSIAVSAAAGKIAERATEHATATYALVPIAKIEPSPSELQRGRRSRFTKEGLEQLAASIRQVGVAEPVLLRPIGTDGFELVAGERRWMAARMAGLDAIPAMVRAYTDEQALEIQLIENLQRVDLHEMEEAEGYDALRKLKKLSVEDIAAQVGKSRSQVFGRLKLLDLCPEARKAFYAGEFEASVALLIARLPGAELQKTVLKDLDGKGEFFWDQEGPPTFRQVQEYIQDEFMADLKGVAFKLDDTTLRAGATTHPACTTCPKRTGNQKDLFTEIKNPNVCTDPACLQRKEEAHRARVRAEHEANGDTIISGAQAKKIKPNPHAYRLNEGYVELDAEEYVGGNYQPLRKAIGKQPVATTLLEDPHTHKLLQIAKRSDVDAALKANGIKPETRSRADTSGKDQERKNRLETAIRTQILAGIRATSRSRAFDLDDTILVAGAFFDRLAFDDRKRLVDAWNAADCIEKPKGHDYIDDFAKKIPTLSPEDLGALFIDMALIGEVYVASWCGKSAPLDLLLTAERLGVDAAAIGAELTAAAKAKQAAKKKGGKQ